MPRVNCLRFTRLACETYKYSPTPEIGSFFRPVTIRTAGTPFEDPTHPHSGMNLILGPGGGLSELVASSVDHGHRPVCRPTSTQGASRIRTASTKKMQCARDIGL
jgi:hypothetical protein